MTTFNLKEFNEASPAQRKRAVDQSYDDGYVSGLEWRDAWEGDPPQTGWRPGGPWV